MSAKVKLGIKGFAAILTLANLALFLLLFIPYYVIEDAEITLGYLYFTEYADEILRWLLPVIAAAVVSIRACGQQFSKAIRPSVLLALSNLAYTVPYYYLVSISRGSDTPEALLMSLGISLLYIILFSAYTLLLVLIIKTTFKRFTAKEIQATLPKEYALAPTKEMWNDCLKEANKSASEKIMRGHMFDFSEPATLGIFFAALMQFTLFFLSEIYTAVSYLITYAGGYKSGEIALMIFRFIFLVIMLFVCHSAAHLAKKHTRSPFEDNNVETKE